MQNIALSVDQLIEQKIECLAMWVSTILYTSGYFNNVAVCTFFLSLFCLLDYPLISCDWGSGKKCELVTQARNCAEVIMVSICAIIFFVHNFFFHVRTCKCPPTNTFSSSHSYLSHVLILYHMHKPIQCHSHSIHYTTHTHTSYIHTVTHHTMPLW